MRMWILVGIVLAAGCAAGCAALPWGESSAEAPAGHEHPLPADQAEVHIQGMACPFCVFNVEKKLREVPGVRSVVTDLESGVSRVEFQGEEAVAPEALWRKAEKSGFTPRKVVTRGGVYRGEE